MKELPKVFANKINKKIDNTQEIYISNKEIKKDNIGVDKKINDIFKSKNHVYKSRVVIRLNNKEITKDIVGIIGNKLLTLDNEMIDIKDIIDIKKTL